MNVNMELIPEQVVSDRLKVAICLPDLRLMHKVIQGESAEATFIIQNYIAEGLRSRGYNLNFLGPYSPDEIVFTGALDSPIPGQQTWTGSLLFNLTSRVVWRIQRLLRIPYLNVFSNIRLLDACLHCLPGHDLVYERNSLHRFGVAMACKRLGIPYILYFEADDILENDVMKKPITGLLRLQASFAIRYNLNAADCVICVSEPLKTHLTQKWNIPTEKIIVFPNVADIQRFRPDAVDARTKIRKSLGMGNVPIVIFVGNFYEWHDVTTLLKAFVEVLKIYPDARLILVGDGTNRQAMAQLATNLNIAHAVVFTGMVAHKDVPHYIAAADIAIVPYPILKQDIWLSPLKLFEYMATGKAIIASNVGQLSEWVSDGRSALLIPPGDVSAMARAIERLIEDPALRLRLGEFAREEAVSKHSWEHYLDRLDKLFALISKGRSVNLM
jgi:glycosyltransferase involved in cell wall biosynthesis